LTPCANPDCRKLRRSHVVCPYCGFYKGRIAIAPKQKKEKSQGQQGEEQN